MWFIGDEFLQKNFSQFFLNAFREDGKVSYIKAHYDTVGMCKARDLNTNILGKLFNAVVKGTNDDILFPKAIILILESDFVKALDHFKPGMTTLAGRSIEWLANQLHRLIITHKEKLPSKARRFRYPMVLWVKLTTHYDYVTRNEYIEKVNTCIENTTSLFREMTTLSIDWDDCDRTLMTKGTMNAKGLTTYWQLLSNAFESWDREQMKGATKNPSCGKKKANPSFYREKMSNDKKFHWNPECTKFKLPKPPKKG